MAGAYAQGAGLNNPMQGMVSMNGYVRELIEAKRTEPDDALLSEGGRSTMSTLDLLLT